MLMLLSVITLAQAGATPFERYTKWAAGHPEFQVQVRTIIPRSPVASSTLLLNRGTSALYHMKWDGLDYVVSSTSHGYREVDYTHRTYDERDFGQGFYLTSSRICPAFSEAFPFSLLQTDIRRLAPPKSTWTVKNVATSAQVSTRFEGEMGTHTEIDVVVASDGTLQSVHSIQQSPMGTKNTLWEFSGYRKVKTTKANDYFVSLPLGYVPFAFENDQEPPQAGTLAPATGWVVAGTSKPVNLLSLAKGKTALWAYLGQDCLPSTASQTSLKRLAKRLPVLRLGGPHVAGADYKDLSGALADKLGASSTPLFLLVGKDGKVIKLWMGYDAAKSAQFEQEIVGAATGAH